MKADLLTGTTGENWLPGGAWRFLPPGTAEVRAALSAPADWLSPGEWLQYQSFKISKRAAEFAASRLAAKQLARSACSLAAGMEFAQIEVGKQVSGAPFLKFLPEGQEMHGFSLSHSQGAALCALHEGGGMEFGIDLEWIEPRPEAFLQDFFTPAERTALTAQLPAQRPLAATLIWSAKEAVLKALRIGLGLDTRQVEIHLPERWEVISSQWRYLKASSPQHDWQVGWQVRAGFVFTLAQTADFPFSWQEIL